MTPTHKHNGREITPPQSVDFDWSVIDGAEAESPDADMRPASVEFELAERITIAIRDADNPALAADQICWLFAWTKEGTRELAARHEYSQPGFLKGAHRLAASIGLKLSPRHLAAATEATD